MRRRRSGRGGDRQEVSQRAHGEEGAFKGWLGGNVGGEADARDARDGSAFSRWPESPPQTRQQRFERHFSSRALFLRHVYHFPLFRQHPGSQLPDKETHRAPIAPLSAVSRETVGGGPTLGVAIGIFPTALF